MSSFQGEQRTRLIKTLHVRGIARTTSKAVVENLFNGVIRPAQVKQVFMHDRYAYVQFSRWEDAEKVKNELNNCIIDGCPLRINWAKPKNKSRIYSTLGPRYSQMCPTSSNRSNYQNFSFNNILNLSHGFGVGNIVANLPTENGHISDEGSNDVDVCTVPQLENLENQQPESNNNMQVVPYQRESSVGEATTNNQRHMVVSRSTHTMFIHVPEPVLTTAPVCLVWNFEYLLVLQCRLLNWPPPIYQMSSANTSLHPIHGCLLMLSAPSATDQLNHFYFQSAMHVHDFYARNETSKKALDFIHNMLYTFSGNNNM